MPDLAQNAFAAGREWYRTGQHSSGVANARVVRYGFLKWWNEQRPYDVQGHSRAKGGKLERAFREGWNRAKLQERTVNNSRRRSKKSSRKAMSKEFPSTWTKSAYKKFQQFERSYGSGKRSRSRKTWNPHGIYIGVPRYSFSPRAGDVFYISGKTATISRTGKSDGTDYVWFKRSVDGMTAMSVSNLYQVAKVPESSQWAPYEYRLKRNPNRLMDAVVKKGGRTFNAKAKYDAKARRVRIFVSPKVARAVNPRTPKTRLYWSVEGNYGYGWEEVTAEDTRADAIKRLREYRENERGAIFRAIKRREKIEAAV